MKIFSWCDLEKRSLRVFFCKRRAPFAKSSNVGCHFCATFHGFCPNFQGFCPNFQEFFPDFRQIKTRGGALAHPRYSRLLHSFFAHFPFGIAPLRIPVLAPLGGRVPIFKGFWRFCCRSVLNPHMPFELVQQESVSCNASSGLECVSRAYGVIRPSEEPFYCLDYELRVLCCDCPEPKVQRKISCVREQPGYGQRWPLRGCKCRTVHPTVDKHINRPLQWRHRVFMLTLRSVS